VIRYVAPSKPPGPYLITSYPDWWVLDDATSWLEPRFGIGYSGAPWVSPMPDTEVAARLEMRVQNAAGSRFTVGAFDGQNITRICKCSMYKCRLRDVLGLRAGWDKNNLSCFSC
jgi:hypothetical protein